MLDIRGLCDRFERTADMLAKSGLLEITMKTADLIRSNQQAQRELNQLKVFLCHITSLHLKSCFHDFHA